MLSLINILIIAVTLTLSQSKSIDQYIVGGHDALEGEFPYQVSIRNRGEHDCGGAILNEYWILTAAHCVRGRLAKKLTVVTGTNYLDHGGDFYNVTKLIPHENFSVITKADDIGLLKVDRPIVFNSKVQRIKLPLSDVDAGVSLTLAGWGRLNLGSKPSNKLQKLELKSISYIKCLLLSQPGIIWFTNLCTDNDEGYGACHGDSGGPLVYDNQVMGIVSWSKPCATGKPDVFTRVYDYLIWIELNMVE